MHVALRKHTNFASSLCNGHFSQVSIVRVRYFVTFGGNCVTQTKFVNIVTDS